MKEYKNKAVKSIAILVGGGLVAWIVATAKPEPAPHFEPPPPTPRVKLIVAEPAAGSVVVTSQGTVVPRREIDLVTQVAGQVQQVDENFVAGGFFHRGQLLLQIDPRDYQNNLIQAQSRLAKARETLAIEKGRALQAKREWRDLGNEDANNLFLRKPQLEAAEAEVAAARAVVDQARLDLERTAIVAPFDGRVRHTSANLGQYLTPGQSAARVFAIDVLEVRLPLTLAQARLLGFESAGMPGELEVTLSASFGSETLSWPARLVRSEAAIDTDSRLFYAIAEVRQSPPEQSSMPLLEVGLFVSAEIESRDFADVVTLPRTALYERSTVLVLDEKDSLRFVEVEILHRDAEKLQVRGLRAGQRVLAEIPGYVTEGMHFQPMPGHNGIASTDAQVNRASQ